MNLKTIGNVYHLLRSNGVWRTLRSLKGRMEDKFLEYKLGISTSDLRSKQDLGLVRDDERPYAPTSYGVFKRLMRFLEIRAGSDVFVDFGTGMGRTVILAGLYPFRRVIGVEISSALCRIAESNANRCRTKLVCKDVSIVESDAMTYPIPPDMTVAFFYNPFTGEVLNAVLENIRRSLIDFPRQIRFVCNDFSAESTFARQMRECPWLVLEKCIPLGDEGQVGSIYVNRPCARHDSSSVS